MDCTEAALLLCAAEDGEPVSSGALALAHAHCSGCSECAAFRETLARLHTVPAPRAPLSLVSRIISAIPENIVAQPVALRTSPGPEAVERAELPAMEMSAEAALQSTAPVSELGRPRKRWSTPRLAIALSTAAVLLLAVGVTSGVLLSGRDASDSGMLATSNDATSESAAIGTPTVSAGTTESGTTGIVVSVAPDYVAFDGVVYLLQGSDTPSESSLTTAGVVTTSLDASGTVALRTAYYLGLDESTLYLGSAETGEYLAFARVSRFVGRTEYVLVTDAALAHFGAWPTLPEQFSTPVTSDGAPSFRLFGFDDLGVNIYVGYGSGVDKGVAIAPGTTVDDPAAGNPNWTWWEPTE